MGRKRGPRPPGHMAAEPLQGSSRILGAIVSHSPVSIICTDAEGMVLMWNPAAERIFGWSAPEVLGKPNPIVPGEKAEEYRRLRERVRDGQPYSAVELERLRKDGTRVTLNASSAPLTDAAGNVIGLLGMFEDISARKRVEDALRENEEKFSTVFRQAPLLTTLSDIETGRLIDVNDRFLEISGFAREEVIGKTVLELGWISEQDRSRMVRTLRERGRVSGMELSLRRKDGTTVVCLYSGETIVVNGQRRLLSMAQDITERKEAEERMRQSEQYVRNILDTVDEGFLVVDRGYRIVTANAAYGLQVGQPCDTVIGKHCYEVSHQAQEPCYLNGEDCAARRVFATGTPHAATHQHRDVHGGIVFVETRCFPIKDGAGAVSSVIETITNITERHLLEEERLKTQKLESIGTLAGGIAHDFNNLLQGVFGYISMAKLTLDQRERSLAMLEQAERALHQSVHLTTQLLTFSKGGRPVRKPTSLLPVIENALKFALSGSRSEYRIESDPRLWLVDADEGQLGQVIQNIVLNADQAMPLGGKVAIAARNLPASDAARPAGLGKRDFVVISVQDSGVGMPAEYLRKIFDPYFTTKEKGSGLGLATSYSIVKNHDGHIEVQSAPGRGSTFHIYLPAAPASAAEAQKAAAPAGTRVGRILLMDDEELVRNVTGELLSALGHTPVFAERGETAIEIYRSARDSGPPIDAVILDLTIRGGMGGEETLGRLLKMDPNVIAVASSGYSDDEGMVNYQRLGFKAFLKKPYNLEDLRQTLGALLA